MSDNIKTKILSTLNYSLLSNDFIYELIQHIIYNTNEKFTFILSKCYDYGFFSDSNIIQDELIKSFILKLITLKFKGASNIIINETFASNANYQSIYNKAIAFYDEESGLKNQTIMAEVLTGKLKNFITVKFLNKLVSQINRGITIEQTLDDSKGFYCKIQDILTEFVSNLSFELDFKEGELGQYIERIEERGNPKSRFGGIKIPSTFYNFDKVLNGGFEKKRFYIIAGLPGSGKSALCAQIAVNAVKQGKNVYYFSLENSLEETMNRLDACVTDIAVDELDINSSLVVSRLEEFLKNTNGRLIVKELPPKTLKPVLMKQFFETKMMQGYPEPDMVIVDYLDLMEANKPYNQLRFKLSDISTELKKFGVENDCVVISPTQLNKATYENDTPNLGNVSESFDKTMIADAVLMIKNVDNPEEVGYNFGLYVAKNRSGKSNVVLRFNVFFDKFRFEEISDTDDFGNVDFLIGSPDYEPSKIEF